jgi:hypothetical protein
MAIDTRRSKQVKIHTVHARTEVPVDLKRFGNKFTVTVFS